MTVTVKHSCVTICTHLAAASSWWSSSCLSPLESRAIKVFICRNQVAPQASSWCTAQIEHLKNLSLEGIISSPQVSLGILTPLCFLLTARFFFFLYSFFFFFNLSCFKTMIRPSSQILIYQESAKLYQTFSPIYYVSFNHLGFFFFPPLLSTY